MQRETPLATDETYHVFNRGAHKRKIFYTDGERQRFQALLLVANQVGPVHLGNLLTRYKGPSFINISRKRHLIHQSALWTFLGTVLCQIIYTSF